MDDIEEKRERNNKYLYVTFISSTSYVINLYIKWILPLPICSCFLLPPESRRVFEEKQPRHKLKSDRELPPLRSTDHRSRKRRTEGVVPLFPGRSNNTCPIRHRCRVNDIVKRFVVTPIRRPGLGV